MEARHKKWGGRELRHGCVHSAEFQTHLKLGG